jgi:adenosylhomocysteine nucleosidase
MKDIAQHPATLSVLTALATEAEALAGPGKTRKKRADSSGIPGPFTSADGTIKIIQCGIGCDDLHRHAVPWLKNTVIVGNIGVSGGLAPDLKPGTVILGNQILTDGKLQGRYQAAYSPSVQLLNILEKTLQQSGQSYKLGSLLCTPQPIASPDAKSAAYRETGALAVDMESAGAAEAARQAGLPFFCIRVICDPAEQQVETKLFIGVDSQGNNRPLRLINPLVRQPWLLVQLLRMAWDFNQACASMQRVWEVVQKPLAAAAGSELIIDQGL